VNRQRRAWACVVALVLGASMRAGVSAQTQTLPDASAPSPVEGTCTVRVAAVAPLDATRSVQAVILEPTVTGSGTISGTVAAFSAAGRRYDLHFENATIGSDAPLVLAYRFPDPVAVTGAYVATLDTPQPGPCSIIEPWTSDAVPDALAQHALATATEATPANVEVSGSGVVDDLTCRSPERPARVLQSARPELEFWRGAGSLPEGTISIRVLVGPDGHALDVKLEHVEGTIEETSIGTAMKSSALVAAMHSTYAPETFRCRPIYGIAYYVMKVQPKP
jgi:hypothetical protein